MRVESKGVRLNGCQSGPDIYMGTAHVSMVVSFQIKSFFLPMSSSSRVKKVKAKGSVRELKLVQSISRYGVDILKTEEVKTPQRGSKIASSSTRHTHSSSPTKRSKLEASDVDPIPFDIEGAEMYNKRQTLVILLPQWFTNVSDHF